MFYLILLFALIAVFALIFLASRGEGGRYGEKEYRKKVGNPFDSFIL